MPQLPYVHGLMAHSEWDMPGKGTGWTLGSGVILLSKHALELTATSSWSRGELRTVFRDDSRRSSDDRAIQYSTGTCIEDTSPAFSQCSVG